MAAPTTRVLKGYKNCPVCGCRYQGELDAHLNTPVKGSDGISRCDWRLSEARIWRTVQRLADTGWKLAGSNGAKTALLVAKTHPHLAMNTTSGSIMTKVHRDYLNPVNDQKAWWIRRWAYPLTQLSGLSLRLRAQVITELEGQTEQVEVIDAAWRIGGIEAVKGLIGGPIAMRCDEVYGNPVDAIISRGHTRLFDRCILAQGHSSDVPHRGAKTDLLWGNGISPTIVDEAAALTEEADLNIEALFEPAQPDEW